MLKHTLENAVVSITCIIIALTADVLFLHFRFEGHMDCPPGMSHPSFSVNHSILEAVRPRLKDFHQLLLEPPKVNDEVSAV